MLQTLFRIVRRRKNVDCTLIQSSVSRLLLKTTGAFSRFCGANVRTIGCILQLFDCS